MKMEMYECNKVVKQTDCNAESRVNETRTENCAKKIMCLSIPAPGVQRTLCHAVSMVNRKGNGRHQAIFVCFRHCCCSSGRAMLQFQFILNATLHSLHCALHFFDFGCYFFSRFVYVSWHNRTLAENCDCATYRKYPNFERRATAWNALCERIATDAATSTAESTGNSSSSGTTQILK